MKKLKLMYIFVCICLVVVIILICCKMGLFTSKPEISTSKKENWIIKEIPFNNEVKDDLAIIPKWDEMSISEQFYKVICKERRYDSRVTKISIENIGKNIGTSILTGYDPYKEDQKYEKKGQLYTIKNIAEECAIAVKFEEDSDYYIYVNSYYRPETLEDLVKDLNLKEEISFGTVYYNYWDAASTEPTNIEFYDVEDDVIWQKLFGNLNLKNVYSDKENYSSEHYNTEIGISIDIPLLGYKNIGLTLTDKGYLITNILDTGKGFYIGEDKVREFLDYVIENYDGYKMVYSNRGEEDVIEENEQNEQIVMVENKTNTETIVNINPTVENRIEAMEY